MNNVLAQIHQLPVRHRSAEHVLEVFMDVSNQRTISFREINEVVFSEDDLGTMINAEIDRPHITYGPASNQKQ